MVMRRLCHWWQPPAGIATEASAALASKPVCSVWLAASASGAKMRLH